MVNNNLPEGKTWFVGRGKDGDYRVYRVYRKAGMGAGSARVDCAREAHAGNPDAIAAVLMCSEDTVLQDFVRACR